MKITPVLFSLLLLFSFDAGAQSFTNAKYGGDFLSVGAGARALGMGSAQAAITNDVTAAYWNPAGLTQVQDLDIAYMHSERFAGIVSYDYGAVAYPLKSSESTIALSIFRQGVDNIANTLNAWDRDRNLPRENPQDYIEEFSVADMAFIFSYAQRTTEHASWGVNAKIVNHRLGPFADAWGYSIDAGAQYALGNTTLGVHLMDITTMMKFWTVHESEFGDFEETFGDEIPSGQNERVLPTVKIGAGHSREIGDFQITGALDVDMRFENRQTFFINLDRISFEPHAGLETTYKNRLSLRAGLTDFTTDTRNNIYISPTLGAGLHLRSVFIDYGFANFGGGATSLGVTHRISARFTL
ncbi:MAG: PorV/PorQ family protein [Balneolaceae bacterium]